MDRLPMQQVPQLQKLPQMLSPESPSARFQAPPRSVGPFAFAADGATQSGLEMNHGPAVLAERKTQEFEVSPGDAATMSAPRFGGSVR
jgi:hypothetical protein